MNEQDWLGCDDSIPMLDFIQTSLRDPLDSPFGKTDSVNEGALGSLHGTLHSASCGSSPVPA